MAQPFPKHQIIPADPCPSHQDSGVTLADAHHQGLDQKGRASRAAPIARSTPSRARSRGKPRASPSLGISHQPATSVASPCPRHCRQSCRRGTAARPGAAFTFLPRAHLSAELSAAPVIGPRRSLVLGVNTAESEKTRAEPSPGASSKAAKYQRTRGGDAQPPPCLPVTPLPRTPKSPRLGCSAAAAVPGIAGVRGRGRPLPERNTGDLGLKK